MSQANKILAHLKAGHSITDNDARRMFSCSRLAARIHDLKKQGHEITEELVTGKNQFGEDCRFSRYRLAPKRRGTLFDLTIYQRIEI